MTSDVCMANLRVLAIPPKKNYDCINTIILYILNVLLKYLFHLGIKF